MRTGGYTLQQSLTNEAATVVKQAVTLARRRGHAQVTPLHVASVMLASSNGLFRKACLQAHSHPLQCKALELCFNVALNRLPTTSSNSTGIITILPSPHHHHHLPSLSNALVAAFKRAQAHQRRGCLENQHQNQQQQPILALKVEIEQLVISILDDPSVSRVMREAGFSSPQVKSKVEHVTTSTAASVAATVESKPPLLPPQLVLGNYGRPQEKKQEPGAVAVRDDDVMSIVGAMMMDSKKTKNTVIVGECTYSAESVVKGVIEKFDTGNVAGDIKHVQFISVPLYTLRNISREEFEEKLSELRSLVKSYLNNGSRGSGVVLYLGDLRWVSEFWSKYCEQRTVINRSQYYNVYSPVEHMIMELSRLLSCAGASGGKIWIMGIATFNTYMKCKSGRPSLESLWDLHPLTIPVGSLSLTLTLDSDLSNNELMMRSKGGEWSNKAWTEKYLTCCADCLANFNKEARSVTTTSSINGSSSLPSWLQQYKEEKQMETFEDDQEFEKIKDLCRKWNSICKSIHNQADHFLTAKIINKCSSPSSSPSSSASISSSTDLNHHHHQQSLLKLRNYYKEGSNKLFAFETKPELLSNPNSSPNSASSSEASEDLTDLRLPHKFFEDNLEKEEAVVCGVLEKKVPALEKELIREIVSTIFKCRSGKSNREREDTWLSFLGPDSEGKDKIGRELAKAVFGSSKEGNFVNIGISAFSLSSSSLRHDDVSMEEVISSSGSKNKKKRPRDERGMSYFERFGVAVRENPSRVFFLEDFDQTDYHSRKRFKRAMESGSLSLPDDDESVLLKDAIIVFISSEESVRRNNNNNNNNNNNGGDDHSHKMEEKSNRTPLDLNVATEEEDDEDENCVSENGILNLVDKKFVFKN